MKKIILTPLVLFMFYANSNSQVVINEVMYGPISPNKEWFEIYNNGSSAINLQNWKWRDAAQSNPVRTITTQNILLQPNSYAVICEDSANIRNVYPNIPGILLQSAGWSALNNSGNENIVLYNSSSQTIDSLTYNNSWGGGSGFSLEKINPTGSSNTSSNWASSIDPLQATPNNQNSITPKPFDLFLKSFTIAPVFPSQGETLQLDFVIKNTGNNSANNFSLNIYRDLNLDSIPQNNEQINFQSYQLLNPGDSLIYNYSITNIDTGTKQFIAKVIYQQDDDTLNNILYKRIYVSSQSGGGGGIVINEIMYDPFTNQSEWIEFYNATGLSVNLKGWKYKETSTTITLSTTDLIMNQGDYFILAHDTTLYITFGYLKTLQQNQIMKFSNGISLNNSGETISLTDSLNNIIDAVSYSPDWNNPNLSDTKGISLERINPAFGSNDRSNWSSCVKPTGGTPGLQNSIYTQNISSNSNVSVIPNPFSPDGDGYEDFTIIKYKLDVPFAQMRIKVFDVKGRLVRTLANNSVTGREGTIIFNGFGDDKQKLRIGIYILLIEAIDDVGGTVERIKTPIVVAAKL